MFNTLFSQSAVIERHRTTPLAAERRRYLAHLEESGSCRKSLRRIANYLERLVSLLDLRDDDMVSVDQVTSAAHLWSRSEHRDPWRMPSSPRSISLFRNASLRWLRFVGRLIEPPGIPRHPHTAEVAAYAEWMRTEKGFSEDTIRSNCVDTDRFFDHLATKSISLASLTIADVDDAVAAKKAQKNYSRVTITGYAQRIRSFLRFAEERRLCAPGIAAAAKPPRTYRSEPIPRGIARPDVVRLLATTEGDRPTDKRNRAILMLFIAYGLRLAEVAALTLDDIDWENETLRVYRPKARRTQSYPLSSGVGQAILRYVLEARPSRPERNLFFTLIAPIRPLRRPGIASVVANGLHRIGIVDGHRGAHSLRHAAAQHLLDQGMSMKTIGDFLGHRQLASTSTYAKVDLHVLREVADFDLGGLS